MWTNISATTKTGEQHSIGRLQDNSINVRANQSETVFSQIDVEAEKNCGSPLMRYKHAVCSAKDGFIYVHGGRYGNLPLDDDVWRFDPHQNTWLRLNTSGQRPPSLQEHTLVEYEQHLYLFGGQVSTPSVENSFWRLNLVTFEWQSLDLKSSKKFGTYLGPTNRRGHSAVIFGNSMYIFGGFEDFRGSSGQLWEYQFSGRRWLLRNLSSTSSCQPEPRHSHSAVVYGDSMFIYGGLSDLKSLGDLWRWSWPDKRWYKERTRGNSPGQLHGHAAIQAFGSMFVFGGERADGRSTRGLWRLNFSNMTWQKIRPKGPRPNPTTWHAAIANPLNILDEANYIIEGDEELANLPSNSMSDTSIHSSIRQPGAAETEMRRLCVLEQKARDMQDKVRSQIHQLEATEELGKCQTRNKRLRLSFLQRKRRSKSQASGLSQICRSSSSTVSTNRNVPKLDIDHPPSNETNSKILDNLDSDIKEMFQQAFKPATDELEASKSVEVIMSQETMMSQFETANSLLDSNLLSQRTSLAAYATPPSELANHPTSSDSVTVNQRRPVQRDRPKSEIVQSLIERADARIKHLYTPFFANHQTNDQLNQRHQKYISRTSGTTYRPERLSLDARNKRHTIHQTMTYYNLYFSEDKTSSNSPPSSDGGQTAARSDTANQLEEDEEEDGLRRHMTRDDLSYASTLKDGSTGTLVGVTKPLSSDNPQSFTSELSFCETESRTLRPSDDKRQGEQGSSTKTTNTITSMHSALTSQELPDSEQPMHVDNNLISPTRTGSAADNTSLSFSVIAEFEEDDMLQYSSPTEPMISQLDANNRQTVIFAATSSRPKQEEDMKTELKQVAAYKSSSSGYGDSLSAERQSDPNTSPLASSSGLIDTQENSSLRTESSSGFNLTDGASPERRPALLTKSKGQTEATINGQTLPMQIGTTTTSSSNTADSLLMTSDGSLKTDTSSPVMDRIGRGQTNLTTSPNSLVLAPVATEQRREATTKPKFFGKRKSTTRYWQLCMFVIGGKQNGIHGLNEPLTVWRLYI